MDALLASTFALTGVAAGALGWTIRRRNLQRWLPAYYFPAERPLGAPPTDAPVDVFIAICDHYEPEWGAAAKDVAIARVEHWRRRYPRMASEFRDSSGRMPQHTFFFPQDQYAPEYLDRLAALCEQGCGDVDVHLHHDNDTADHLRDVLDSFRETLFHRHGLLRRDPVTGEIVYGFIHGNWALCNSRPDGRWCGVDNEIAILRETGCYADFTMPSAPDCTQTPTINSIYYAQDRPGRSNSHARGVRAQVGVEPTADGLLMVQGPLRLDWRDRKRGIMPRIENGDLLGNRPPSWQRFRLWLEAGVHVAGKPDWRFIKLHTHGCKPGNTEMLLGEPMRAFHRALARHAVEHPQFRYHYVTAWEMAQRVHAAEAAERSLAPSTALV